MVVGVDATDLLPGGFTQRVETRAGMGRYFLVEAIIEAVVDAARQSEVRARIDEAIHAVLDGGAHAVVGPDRIDVERRFSMVAQHGAVDNGIPSLCGGHHLVEVGDVQ